MFYLPLSLFIFISLPSSSTILSFSLLNVFIPASQFYYFPSSMFLFPPPQFYYFPSYSLIPSLSTILIFPHLLLILFLSSSSTTFIILSFLNSLPLHNINLSPPPPHLFSSSVTIFIIFPPQSWFPSSSTISLFSLLHLHLLVYSIYFSIHKYIDLLSTPHWPHIDPTSTLDSTFFQHSLVNSETIYNHHHILSLPHHHHISIVSLHHHHISIVFPPPPSPPPPPPHFYCFPSTTTFLLFSLLLLFCY